MDFYLQALWIKTIQLIASSGRVEAFLVHWDQDGRVERVMVR